MQEKDRRYVLLDRLEKEGLGLSKLLISLATGTVVLSITFLQLFDPQTTDHHSLLVAAWIALVASIILGLIDRIVYVHGLAEHPLLVLTENDEERTYQEQRWSRYLNASEKISWLQIVTFGAGITLLLSFAITTIS